MIAETEIPTKQLLDETYLDRVQTFDAPPAGFDVLRASDRELALYGFPRRPSPETEPDLHRLWIEAYSRPIRPMKVRVEVDRVMLDAALHRRKGPKDGFSPGGWGGILTKKSDYGFVPDEPAVMVYGEWALPSMRPDFDNPTTPMTVGFWVGIDGSGNNQVLQAGTAATVTGETIDHWAWFEWWPAPPVKLVDFPVEQGDTVRVLVCAPSPTKGFASFLNETTGVTANVGFDPPTGVTSSLGDTAEWIVEGVSADLPNFVIVGFHNCRAGTKTHHLGLERPTKTEISGASAPLTFTVLLDRSDTVVVLWQGIR